MSRRCLSVLVVCSTVGLCAAVVSAGTVTVCFNADGNLQFTQRTVPDGASPVETALAALAAGPTAAERAAGVVSAIPAGTRIERLTVGADSIAIDFSADLLSGGLDDLMIEAIFKQANCTVRQFGLDGDVKLTVGDQLLATYLPPVAKPTAPAPTRQVASATPASLTGHSVTLSPGHGIFWNGSGWYTQRPVYCSPLNEEDFHTLEMCQYLESYLVADGMTVKMVRCTNKSYGNHSTGNPWWKMASYLWLQNLGYPCSVYASYTGDCTTGTGASESNDDVRARPLASDYDATDIYVAVHTNGYAGDCTGSCPTGTETYYDTSQEHRQWGAVSQTLANNINPSIMSAITANVDPSWICHGACTKDSNGAYGEIRIPDRAATLTELAFHDTCDRDADANHLRDNFFRSAAMWGIYNGICGYFGQTPTWGFYSDEYVSDTIPTTMAPGQSYTVSVTFRNRGAVWSAARAFRLGAVGDSDPFTSFNRVELSGEVGPGQSNTFSFQMTAPTTEGNYVTDWRMVRDGVTWFGATLTKTVHVGSGTGDTEPPTTPTNLTATATSSTSVQLNWTVSTDNVGVVGYDIRRDGAPIGSSVTNSYTDNTVSPGTTYTYDVRAFDAVPNYSGWSNPATVTTPTPPDAVTIVTATYTTRTSTLSVEATSSRQPTAVLTVSGFGQMTWNSKKAVYTYTKKPTSNPGTVTVTSSLGGSATATVTVK